MESSQTPVYDAEKVQSILPHRYPFLFIDKVISVSEGPKSPSREGRKATAVKNVTFNEPYFPGHFPGRPIMPGVILIETMAQAAAMACFREGERPLSIVIARVKEARFRKPVVPGDQLILTADVLRDRGKLLTIACQAHVDGSPVAEAEILAHVTTEPES